MIFFLNTLTRSSPFFHNRRKNHSNQNGGFLVTKFQNFFPITEAYYKKGKWQTRLRIGRRTVTIGPRLISSIIVGRPYTGVILLISNRISKTGGRNPRAAITIHPICAWSQKWTQGDSLLNQLQRWRDAREEGRKGVDARPGRWLITKIFDLCERSCSDACVMSAYYISRTPR